MQSSPDKVRKQSEETAKNFCIRNIPQSQINILTFVLSSRAITQCLLKTHLLAQKADEEKRGTTKLEEKQGFSMYIYICVTSDKLRILCS
jgi:hypothetical protein